MNHNEILNLRNGQNNAFCIVDKYSLYFFRQSCLGMNTNLNDSESVIRKCINLADIDMLTGGRFIINEDYVNLHSQDDRIRYLYAKLNEAEFVRANISIEEICTDCFWNWNETKIKSINGTERTFRSCGLAQKFLNMTYKYFFVFRDCIGREIDFSQCDCPLDSDILNKLGRQEKWTRLLPADYANIQEQINGIIVAEDYPLRNVIGRLAYDYNWGQTDN